MDLWIRSQDKEVLQKITSLFVNDDGYIFSYDYINSNEVFLGKYKTKERALEVLDEIHNILMPISEYKQEIDNLIINYKNIDTVVYEMPKE